MKVVNYQDVPLEDVNIEGAAFTKIRWLIGQKDNAPNFALRLFEVAEGGHTPLHSHDYEHEVFVLEGQGVFVCSEGEKPFKAWDVIYVDPSIEHQFRNTGAGSMKFLCIIPHDKPKVKKVVNPFASGTANNC
ncbi:MAG TPA: cupin domain-containing protein [Candidatus Cloacimonadota bacterium]|nr:cupin domain-containing protein [Candidatus Cloacimonadota bacterium]HOD54775.1 cupin domain-containing protein [Candidatus Cloacimonadota bacterium]HPM01639.1 cupin domain-containing protein [Candidatus Cloacimonadota bacterium]